MPNYKKLRQIGAIGSLFWLLWVSVSVIIGLIKQPFSYTLTEEYIGRVCDSMFFKDLAYIGLPFLGIFIALAFMGTTEKDKHPASKAAIIFLVACIILIFALDKYNWLNVKETINIITHEPRVERVTLSDKYAVGYRRSTGHYFVFSNGSTNDSEESEYDAHSVGDEFYVIMCGDSCVKHYDPDQYELP